jgi:hypothetical protein
MENLKHTKGEWRATEAIPKLTGDCIKIIGNTESSEYCVGEVYYINSLTEMEANAKLIAAAPNMLEALTKLMDLIDNPLMSQIISQDNIKDSPQWAKAVEAIQKATK